MVKNVKEKVTEWFLKTNMRIYWMLMAMCLPKFNHQGTNNLIQVVLRATQTLDVLLFVCLSVFFCFFFFKKGFVYCLAWNSPCLMKHCFYWTICLSLKIYIYSGLKCLICCSVLKKTCILVPEITAGCKQMFF